MTNTSSRTGNDDHTPTALDDPRPALAAVTAAVGRLIAETAPEAMGRTTPCPEFTVKDLTEHIVLVVRRIAAIGQGAHWSSVTEEAIPSGLSDEFRAAVDEMERAWADPDQLDGVYEVPWGMLPAGPMLAIYSAELATHGWDLATATDRTIVIDDDLLAPALEIVRIGLPAEGRGPEMPFDPVVDPGPDAPVVARIAGWLGRAVT